MLVLFAKCLHARWWLESTAVDVLISHLTCGCLSCCRANLAHVYTCTVTMNPSQRIHHKDRCMQALSTCKVPRQCYRCWLLRRQRHHSPRKQEEKHPDQKLHLSSAKVLSETGHHFRYRPDGCACSFRCYPFHAGFKQHIVLTCLWSINTRNWWAEGHSEADKRVMPDSSISSFRKTLHVIDDELMRSDLAFFILNTYWHWSAQISPSSNHCIGTHLYIYIYFFFFCEVIIWAKFGLFRGY